MMTTNVPLSRTPAGQGTFSTSQDPLMLLVSNCLVDIIHS